MLTPGSNASDSGNNSVDVRRDTGYTSRLSPEKLARKRANDRESQRAIRARNKTLVDNLQREVQELRRRVNNGEIQRLLRHIEVLESELRLHRESHGLGGHRPGYHHLVAPGSLADNLSGSEYSPDTTGGFSHEYKSEMSLGGDNTSTAWSLSDQEQQNSQHRYHIPHPFPGAPRGHGWNLSIPTEHSSDVSRISERTTSYLLVENTAAGATGLGLVMRPNVHVAGTLDATQPAKSSFYYADPNSTDKHLNQEYVHSHYPMNRDYIRQVGSGGQK
ncbi:hypothetical protein QQS21_007794 [Conoideocrella luteorostrata]|uniref:BZIP domain-containing protein n=1 Tax=Conoideocrella luteorostrata TaxID=1105319 RepID=A0AAJ0CMF9_9HYPO|nr:hypothetical protein QQS21_007794 [Conoideocrella luteorostrata]